MRRIIHQIWVGGPPPPLVTEWMAAWQGMNPGWRYQLWGEDEVRKLGCHQFKDQFSNPAFFSDHARLEILAREGGIYIDADFQPLKPLDQLVPMIGSGAFMGRPTPTARHGANGFMGSLGDLTYFRRAFLRLLNCPPGFQAGPMFYHDCVGYEGAKLLAPIILYPYSRGQRPPAKYGPRSIAVHHWLQSWVPEQRRKAGLLTPPPGHQQTTKTA